MIIMIEIDEIDKRILFELEKNARVPHVKLAKIIRKSKDTVRYRIQRLESGGVILGYKTWIDPAKLGYRVAGIYMKVMNLPEKKKKLIEEIKKDKRTYWIGIGEGAWNIGVSYFIHSNKELVELKNNLFSRYKDLIIESTFTSLVNVSIHEKTFFVKQTAPLLTFTEEVGHYDLDAMSKKILRELYHHATINIATLAEKYSTTVDIVRNRMKKLEESKIIIRYSAIINYQKIGYEFYKAFIYLKSFLKEEIEVMLRYAEQSDTIINVVQQISPWDFEFVLFAQSFQEYNTVIGKFTERFAHVVKKVETAVMSEDILFPSASLVFD